MPQNGLRSKYDSVYVLLVASVVLHLQIDIYVQTCTYVMKISSFVCQKLRKCWNFGKNALESNLNIFENNKQEHTDINLIF